MASKKFHLGDVLSITTGRLVSPRYMDGVYDILNFMTGESLFTHQLLRAGDICKPVLFEQYPQLKEVDASVVNEKNYEQWIKEQVAKYGEKLSVSPLAVGQYETKNFLQELHEMAPHSKVIPIIIK